MKQTILTAAVAFLIASCGNNTGNNNSNKSDSTHVMDSTDTVKRSATDTLSTGSTSEFSKPNSLTPPLDTTASTDSSRSVAHRDSMSANKKKKKLSTKK